MKVLVTGGAGFIGSHVVKCLEARGHEVRVLHLLSDKLDNLAGTSAETITGDVTDKDSLRRAMKGCQQVIHLAAIYALWLPKPELMRQVNVEGTRNVLDVASELDIERVVCTSSIARFGGQGPNTDATEESPFALAATKNLYAITKAEGHEVAVAAAKRGQNVVIAAPVGPVGPGDIGPTPTGKLILACAALPVMAVPSTITNFGDVRDIAEGHVLAAEKGVPGESYLLGNQNLSAAELARATMNILGVKRPIFPVPFAAAKIAGKAALWAADNVLHSAPLITDNAVAISKLSLRADCSKAVRELGLPQRPIEESLRDALIWFTDNGYLNKKRLTPHFLNQIEYAG